MVSTIEEQVETFASGEATEYAFPAELTAQERKLVKKTAEKFGLPSCSYGMGSERRIHIFRPAMSTAQVLKPVEYSVKNTFVDGIVTPPCMLPGPAHQSMPAGGLQEHIAAEEIAPPKVLELGATLCEKLDVMLSKTGKISGTSRSPRNTPSGGSTADSESESSDPTFCIKNTFVHFETDSDENGDPRIIQSMPSGKFAESVDAEKEAKSIRGKQAGRPVPFADDPEDDAEGESALVFPATPNAEGHIIALGDMPASKDAPVVQWIPPTAAMPDSSITVLPPAFWKPSPAQILLDSPITPRQEEQPQAATQGQVTRPTAHLVPPVPPPLLPGTPVVVSGLASQPRYNGLRGWVIDFDSHHSRYNIAIEIGPNSERSLVKVKPHNLAVVQQLLPPQPLYYPTVQQQVMPARPVKASLCLDQMV